MWLYLPTPNKKPEPLPRSYAIRGYYGHNNNAFSLSLTTVQEQKKIL